MQQNLPWTPAGGGDSVTLCLLVVGELGGSLTNVKVKFTLSKKKNKNPSTTKTKSVTFTAQPYTSDDPASYPSDLWCPQEDVVIYTESSAVVNEVRGLVSSVECRECCDPVPPAADPGGGLAGLCPPVL